MAIYNAAHGGKSKGRIDRNCEKAPIVCVAPEDANSITTTPGYGQGAITLEQVIQNLGSDYAKLAVGDSVIVGLVPTQSFLASIANKSPCKLGGLTYEFELVRQNGVAANGDVAYDKAPLAAGVLATTVYTKDPVTLAVTSTVTVAAGVPAAIGATATNVVYGAPRTAAEYFGSFGGVAIKILSLPTATDTCKSSIHEAAFGACDVFHWNWENLQPCVRKCQAICNEAGSDIVVLA
jgi:hypothetical protein